MVTGVVIPKLGKPVYHEAKAYSVIALRIYLVKVVEKVVTTRISEECEMRGLLHNGQFGCRKRRSAVDAVGMMVRRGQEGWRRANLASAILMDIKGAFPSVMKGNFVQVMQALEFEADLCRWVESFMSDRKVKIKMDRRREEVMGVQTGVPKGLLTSPILFAIYIAGLFKIVEKGVPEVTMLSFVDDVAWVVEGKDAHQCTSYMQRCARRAIQWVEMNAVQFDIGKTKAVLFSKKRNHQWNKVKMRIQVDENNSISLNSKPMRWLGLGKDRKLNFQHHHEVVMTKAKKVHVTAQKVREGRGRLLRFWGNGRKKIELDKTIHLGKIRLHSVRYEEMDVGTWGMEVIHLAE
jgi:hypothetical protein